MTRLRWLAAVASLSLAVFGLASWAAAETGPASTPLARDVWPAVPTETPGTPPAFESADARRPVPDYDGLPPASPDALDYALGVPRGLLAPVHLVIEHGLRRPLELIVTEIEKTRFWE